MGAVSAQRERCGVDRLHRAHRITLDARDLHQAADGIAAHSEMVLDADFRGVFDLRVAAAERRGEAGRRHRAGDADFALAPDFRAGKRCVSLAQASDRRRGEQKGNDAVLVGFLVELAIVADHRRDHACCPVGGCGDHAASRCVFLVDRDRIDAYPVDHLRGAVRVLRPLGDQRIAQSLGAAADVESSR